MSFQRKFYLICYFYIVYFVVAINIIIVKGIEQEPYLKNLNILRLILKALWPGFETYYH